MNDRVYFHKFCIQLKLFIKDGSNFQSTFHLYIKNEKQRADITGKIRFSSGAKLRNDFYV